MWLGLSIQHQPHWHTYWKNPGDSGLATTLSWQLPDGVRAGDIEWPTPQQLPVGPLMNYGYEGQVLLPVAADHSRRFQCANARREAAGGLVGMQGNLHPGVGRILP
ncbi:protein-disulfide reductase DsbD domain-containing protein [Cupriavidus alkaliphilus]|uniref:protein-disulfide reductase DsbD domain-containing protein n=1 Tax=Cupriavidus alkaliphilus TaxID=942866 RepID=UPI00339D4CB8